MHGVVHESVRDVTDHQPSGDSARRGRRGFMRQHFPQTEEQRRAQPGWGADQGTRVFMVQRMQPTERWHAVQHPAVQCVLKRGPRQQAHSQRGEPAPSSLRWGLPQ